MPLQNTTNDGTLTISGISLNPANGAWGVFGDRRGEGGLVKLWADFDVRGGDRLLPGVTGVIAYPRRMTITRKDLTLWIVGDVIGQTGATASDSRVGLATNVEYLRANVLAPVVSSTGTRSAILTVPGLTSRTEDIHVLGMVTQEYMMMECGAALRATLQISIPSGRFA